MLGAPKPVGRGPAPAPVICMSPMVLLAGTLAACICGSAKEKPPFWPPSAPSRDPISRSIDCMPSSMGSPLNSWPWACMGSPAIIYTHETVVQICRGCRASHRTSAPPFWYCAMALQMHDRLILHMEWSRVVKPRVIGADGFPESKMGFLCCVHAHAQLWHDDNTVALASPMCTAFLRFPRHVTPRHRHNACQAAADCLRTQQPTRSLTSSTAGVQAASPHKPLRTPTERQCQRQQRVPSSCPKSTA
jgi:hypothetical protein